MKKRMRVGQPFLILGLMIAFVLMALIVIFFFEEKDIQIFNFLIFWSCCVLAIFLILSFDENFGCYMEMAQNTVLIRTLFISKKLFLKSEIKLTYGVYELQGRSGKMLVPCVALSTEVLENFLFSQETTGSKKMCTEKYCLVLLTNSRLKKITEYFNREIRLPREGRWVEYCRSTGIYAKNLSKFYRKIGEYNNILV